MKREFVFELKEIDHVFNRKMPDCREAVITYTTGTVLVDDEEIYIFVDDKNQPRGSFQSKDTLFNKLTKKLHESTINGR